MKNLSVVIPCYNEEKRFSKGMDHFLSYLDRVPYSWELVLVNDGSADNTLKLMNKAKFKNHNIEVVSYIQNEGKGYALKKGIEKAEGKFILFSDIDYSVPIQTIGQFLPYFNKGYEIVIGSRRVKGAQFVRRQNAFREFLGKGFTLLVRLLVDPKIKDATCGFKVFKKDVAKKVFKKMAIYNWSFDAEILFLCKKYGYKVAQVPVKWKNDPGTKVSLKRDVISSLLGILKIQANNLLGKY